MSWFAFFTVQDMFSFCNISSYRFTRQIFYQRRSWLEITSSRWSKCKTKKLIFDKNMTFPFSGLVLRHVRVFRWAKWPSAETPWTLSVLLYPLSSHRAFWTKKKVEKMEQKGNKPRMKWRLGEQVYPSTTLYFCYKTKNFASDEVSDVLSSAPKLAFGFFFNLKVFGSSVMSRVTNCGNPFHSAGSQLLLS